MVLNQINQESLFEGILMQLAIAVAERNYESRNLYDKQYKTIVHISGSLKHPKPANSE